MMKRIISFFMILMLSMNSFAVAVSDNDGSAFITKAEFDSLKNSFQSHLNQYNNSIDSKIDTAISEYLAGITTLKEPTNLIDQFVSSTGEKMTWVYNLPGVGSNLRTNEININSIGYITRRSVSNLNYKAGAWLTSAGYPTGGGYAVSAITFGHPEFDITYGYSQHALAYARLGYIQEANDTWMQLPTNWTDYYTANASQATYDYYNSTSSYKERSTTGSGSGWLYQNLNGVNVLKYYCTAIYPKIDLEYYVHWYKYFPASTYSTYTSSAGFTFNDVAIANLGTLVLELGNTKSLGSRYGLNSTLSGKYISGSAALIKTTDGNNYLNTVWAVPADITIYCNNEDYNGVLATSDSETVWPTSLKYVNQYYSSRGMKSFQSSYPATTTKYRAISYEPEVLEVGNFGHPVLTTIAGKPMYNGEGAPCIYVATADKSIKITLKLTTNSGNATCDIAFSDDKFNNGNLTSGASLLATANLTTGSSETITFQPTKKGLVYMFIRNTTNTNPIIIDEFNCSLAQ